MTLHLRSGLLLRAVALFVLAAAGCGADETGPDRTNLLLITIDTLRADALGAYDPQRTHSPRLDALAAEGVLFEQCLTSSPSTLPSHASILTGLHLYAHGVRSNQGYTLPPEARTLTEVLRAEGYVTAAEVATTVIERQKGLAQGFGRYRDVFSPGVTLKAALKRSGGETERLTFPERDAADITGHGIRFLREHRDTPFFLWLHYFDPHAPYLPPAEFAGRFPESPYHAEVAYADQQVGRVVDALQALGLADRTLLIVTSDHGEALGEHGEGTHSFFVYDSTMRVPLLFWGAGVPRGRRIGPLVRSVDIAPTALDLLGFPELLGVQGVSLRPLFSGEPRDPGLTGYGESIESFATFGTSVLRFVREGRWKYIHKVSPELYDVETDSGELRNRASAEPEVLARLRSRLEALVGETASPGAAAEIAVSETTLAELDAPGYVGSRYRPSVGDELASLELGGVDPRDTVADAKRFSTAWTEYKDKRDYGRAAQLFAGPHGALSGEHSGAARPDRLAPRIGAARGSGAAHGSRPRAGAQRRGPATHGRPRAAGLGTPRRGRAPRTLARRSATLWHPRDRVPLERASRSGALRRATRVSRDEGRRLRPPRPRERARVPPRHLPRPELPGRPSRVEARQRDRARRWRRKPALRGHPRGRLRRGGGLRGVPIGRPFKKIFQRHRSLVATPAEPHGDGSVRGLPVPDHQHQGDLLQLGQANLCTDLLIAHVRFDPQSQLPGFFAHVLGEFDGSVRN